MIVKIVTPENWQYVDCGPTYCDVEQKVIKVRADYFNRVVAQNDKCFWIIHETGKLLYLEKCLKESLEFNNKDCKLYAFNYQFKYAKRYKVTFKQMVLDKHFKHMLTGIGKIKTLKKLFDNA